MFLIAPFLVASNCIFHILTGWDNFCFGRRFFPPLYCDEPSRFRHAVSYIQAVPDTKAVPDTQAAGLRPSAVNISQTG